MKENNSEKNSDKKNYDLSEINKGNDIEFNISNIENFDNTSKKISNTKKERLNFNYSLLLKNIISDIKNNRKQRYYEDEFKINLLLMTSFKNKHFKLLCLNLLLQLNNKKEFSNLAKYIISKIKKYHNADKNNDLNKKSLLSIYVSTSRILYLSQNFFYSFFYAWKARNLVIKMGKKKYKEEFDEINYLFEQAKDMIVNHINLKENYFNEGIMDKLQNINKILDSLLRESQIKDNKNNDQIQNDDINDIEDDNSDYGSYMFLINKEWIMKAKVFIDYYIIASQEQISETNSLKKVFDLNNILNSFFKLEASTSQIYPGPINNFNLINYKDCWEDPNNEDENYYIDKNSNDFIKISEKNYKTL